MQINASMLQILEMRFKLYVLERLLCTIVNTTTILHTAPGDCEEALQGRLHCCLLASVSERLCAKIRGGKRCERCEHCSCKDFTIGVKILVKNVIMGVVNFFLSKIVFGECYKGWCFLVFYTVSLCFTLLTCVLHLFGIGFVANRAL